MVVPIAVVEILTSAVLSPVVTDVRDDETAPVNDDEAGVITSVGLDVVVE